MHSTAIFPLKQITLQQMHKYYYHQAKQEITKLNSKAFLIKVAILVNTYTFVISIINCKSTNVTTSAFHFSVIYRPELAILKGLRCVNIDTDICFEDN